jgi:hypothetical protein
MQPSWAAAESVRTRKLTLDDRAALSDRAYIRHRFTSYHDDLDAVSPEHWDEEYLYRESKVQRTTRSIASFSSIAAPEASRSA